MEMMEKTVNTQYVEEEIIIAVKYMEKNVDNMMIIDSGAPVSIVSAAWFDEYIKDAKVDNDEIKKKNCARRFRLGKTLYISEVEVKFPIIMKTDNNDFIRREVTANIIVSDEVTFLCGKQTVKELKTTLDFTDGRLRFKEKDKCVDLTVSEGGHLLAKLELVDK